LDIHLKATAPSRTRSASRASDARGIELMKDERK